MSTATAQYTVLTLPFASMRTLHRAISEVRLYNNEITGVPKVGKRVSALGSEETIVFREAKLLQKISNDYVVPVHDVAVVTDPDCGDPAIKVIEMVMPFYPKGSVCDALLRGDKFSVGKAVRIVRDCLLGLSHLHEEHGMLHGDVKSGNVFLDDSHARIGDLGMAVPMEAEGTAEPLPASQVSTPPETLVHKRICRGSDLYGAGLVLHELLNGPLAYGEYGPGLIARRLSKGKRAVLNQHLDQQPHVPPRLRSIITKALSIEPQDRYSTAREMVDALDHAPYVDWHRTSDLSWEGEVPSAPGTKYQVTATRVRRPERWRLSARRLKTEWRRFLEDQDVANLVGRETRDFFDQLVRQATSR